MCVEDRSAPKVEKLLTTPTYHDRLQLRVERPAHFNQYQASSVAVDEDYHRLGNFHIKIIRVNTFCGFVQSVKVF